MGKKYEPAKPSELKILQDVLEKHHPRLTQLKTRVAMIFVFDQLDEQGHAKAQVLKHRGVWAAAVAKINSLKLRAQGLADAEITVDQYVWERSDPATRVAILDHELTHLDPKFKDNVPQLDDLNRPKLQMRYHDFEHGWFVEVAERNGAASIEVQQAQRFMEESGQFWLDFGPGRAAANWNDFWRRFGGGSEGHKQ